MIFVDTSFWVALRNRRDGHLRDATQLLERHRNDALVTTNHVAGETWTFLRRRAGHTSAVDFLEALGSSLRIEVVHLPEEIEDEAWAWLRRHDEREYSFVDATSFALMGSKRLKVAFAFDGDFTAAGFQELRV